MRFRFPRVKISRAFIGVMFAAAYNVARDPADRTRWIESACLLVTGTLPQGIRLREDDGKPATPVETVK